MKAYCSLRHSYVFFFLLFLRSAKILVDAETISDTAERIANDISAILVEFGDQVLFADELQALWDQNAILHPNSPFIIPGTIAEEYAALVEKFVVLDHLEPLRKLHAAATDVATQALDAVAAAVTADANGDPAAAPQRRGLGAI